ncbi:hypothetical protein, partial [uncultured Stenotrophomonas sp.]|uniref:hypothetical protein n=1 Tax=uncultured Stenotrophomonas sp. TaxID=165438 RepID=UPI0028D542E6
AGTGCTGERDRQRRGGQHALTTPVPFSAAAPAATGCVAPRGTMLLECLPFLPPLPTRCR